jgi:hypothetical protein
MGGGKEFAAPTKGIKINFPSFLKKHKYLVWGTVRWEH